LCFMAPSILKRAGLIQFGTKTSGYAGSRAEAVPSARSCIGQCAYMKA
jgi:hypothetical protein